MREVQYDQAFMFAYSERAKTLAAKRLVDDVPADVKLRRLREVIDVFQTGAAARHRMEVGKRHLVLLEGPSKRSTPDAPEFVGRTHNNKRCIVAGGCVRWCYLQGRHDVTPVAACFFSLLCWAVFCTGASVPVSVDPDAEAVAMQAGQFVVADVHKSTAATLMATPVAQSSITEFFAK